MTPRSLNQFLRQLRLANNRRDLNDGELLARFCATREEAAFAILVQRHGPMVLALCRRILRNLHDAEDACQATFLVLVRKAGTIRKRESLASWLYGVARRIALRSAVQSAARRGREARMVNLEYNEPVDAAMIDQELLSLLDEEIGRLPEKYRAPLVLCHLEGKTYEQAAAELDWPKSSLASRLERARLLLHKRLLRRGAGVPAGFSATVLTAEAAPASVPAALTLAVVRAATLIAAGKAATTVMISPHVAGLVDEAVAALSASKVKLMLVLTLLLAATGSIAIAQLAATTEQPALQAGFLDEQPKEKPQSTQQKQARTDLYGDPLPPGAVARLGTIRYRVQRSLATAFDAEGKTFVSSWGGVVLVSELRTGEIVRRFLTQGRVDAVAMSPDGRTVASAGGPMDDLVRIWDTASGRELRQLKGELGGFGQVLLFAPDGKKLARANRETCLWDLVTGKQMWKHGVDARSEVFLPAAFSPDGKTLIGTERHDVVLLETESGRELRRFKGPGRGRDLAFSSDRKLMASQGQGNWTIQLWDVGTGKVVREIPDSRSTGEHFAFSPDGKVLAWSSVDKSIRLLDMPTGKVQRRVAKGLGTASSLTFFRDNRTLAFSLWNENAVRAWDLERDRELYPFGGHRGRMHGALFSPDGRTVISASMDNTIRYWDAASAKELDRTEAHFGGVWCLALTADGKNLASASLNDPHIRLWSTATRKETARLQLKEGAHALVFSPDGNYLVTASPGTPDNRDFRQRNYVLRLWNTASAKELRRWDARSAHGPVTLSLDGKFLASEDSGSIVVWDALTGGQHRRIELVTPASVNDLAFSPDGRTLVSAQRDGRVKNPQSAVRFWELATGKERLSAKTVPGWDKSLAFSPDGKLIAVGGADRRVHVLNYRTGQVIRSFEGHDGDITSVAFAPDGKSLASGSADTTILIWKIEAPPRARPVDLSPRELAGLWNDLASADAMRAYRAITTMSAAPRTVAYLAERLRPVAPPDPARLARLIADLDSEHFPVRDKASEELARLRELAEPILRQALAAQPSLEYRRRLEVLMRKLLEPITSPETMRSLRALEVLESIGTREARETLKTVVGGSPHSMVTQAAQAALQRAP